MQEKNEKFLNPITNPNFGWRTGTEVLKPGQQIRINANGFENFDDYFDSEAETDSIASDATWVSDQKSAPQKPRISAMSSFSSAPPSTGNQTPKPKVIPGIELENQEVCENVQPVSSQIVLAEGGDSAGSLTKDASGLNAPASALKSYQSRRRIQFNRKSEIAETSARLSTTPDLDLPAAEAPEAESLEDAKRASSGGDDAETPINEDAEKTPTNEDRKSSKLPTPLKSTSSKLTTPRKSTSYLADEESTPIVVDSKIKEIEADTDTRNKENYIDNVGKKENKDSTEINNGITAAKGNSISARSTSLSKDKSLIKDKILKLEESRKHIVKKVDKVQKVENQTTQGTNVDENVADYSDTGLNLLNKLTKKRASKSTGRIASIINSVKNNIDYSDSEDEVGFHNFLFKSYASKKSTLVDEDLGVISSDDDDDKDNVKKPVKKQRKKNVTVNSRMQNKSIISKDKETGEKKIEVVDPQPEKNATKAKMTKRKQSRKQSSKSVSRTQHESSENSDDKVNSDKDANERDLSQLINNVIEKADEIIMNDINDDSSRSDQMQEKENQKQQDDSSCSEEEVEENNPRESTYESLKNKNKSKNQSPAVKKNKKISEAIDNDKDTDTLDSDGDKKISDDSRKKKNNKSAQLSTSKDKNIPSRNFSNDKSDKGNLSRIKSTRNYQNENVKPTNNSRKNSRKTNLSRNSHSKLSGIDDESDQSKASGSEVITLKKATNQKRSKSESVISKNNRNQSKSRKSKSITVDLSRSFDKERTRSRSGSSVTSEDDAKSSKKTKNSLPKSNQSEHSKSGTRLRSESESDYQSEAQRAKKASKSSKVTNKVPGKSRPKSRSKSSDVSQKENPEDLSHARKSLRESSRNKSQAKNNASKKLSNRNQKHSKSFKSSKNSGNSSESAYEMGGISDPFDEDPVTVSPPKIGNSSVVIDSEPENEARSDDENYIGQESAISTAIRSHHTLSRVESVSKTSAIKTPVSAENTPKGILKSKNLRKSLLKNIPLEESPIIPNYGKLQAIAGRKRLSSSPEIDERVPEKKKRVGRIEDSDLDASYGKTPQSGFTKNKRKSVVTFQPNVESPPHHRRRPNDLDETRKSLPRYSTSSPIHLFETSRTDTPAPAEKPKLNKIINPSTPAEGLRRSRRVRVQPLAWYKGERIRYKFQKRIGYSIDGVIEPANESTMKMMKPKQKKARNKQKLEKVVDKKRGKYRNPREKRLSVHTGLPANVNFDDNDGNIECQHPDTGESVLIECMKSRDSYYYVGPGGLEKTPDDPVILCKPLQQLSFSMGMLNIRALQEKGFNCSKNDTLSFFIVKGKVAVTIHETTAIMETKDMFFVPRGNIYNIKNLRRDDAILFYHQMRD